MNFCNSIFYSFRHLTVFKRYVQLFKKFNTEFLFCYKLIFFFIHKKVPSLNQFLLMLLYFETYLLRLILSPRLAFLHHWYHIAPKTLIYLASLDSEDAPEYDGGAGSLRPADGALGVCLAPQAEGEHTRPPRVRPPHRVTRGPRPRLQGTRAHRAVAPTVEDDITGRINLGSAPVGAVTRILSVNGKVDLNNWQVQDSKLPPGVYITFVLALFLITLCIRSKFDPGRWKERHILPQRGSYK